MNEQWLVLSLRPPRNNADCRLITLTFGVESFKCHVSATGWSTIQFQCPQWETVLPHRQKWFTFNGTLYCWSDERMKWLILQTPLMLFLARDFMVQPNFPSEVRFKHHFSLNIQLRDADVSQIHLQVGKAAKVAPRRTKAQVTQFLKVWNFNNL